jgi:predicted N-acetyltransferase YhbS
MNLGLRQIRDLLPEKLAGNLSRYRCAHVHALVGNPRQGCAYSMFRGEGSHEHFTRIYLQTGTPQPFRYGFHGGNWVPKAMSHARRFGMTVISGLPIPGDLKRLVLKVPQFVSMSVDLRSSEEDFRKTMSSSALSDLRVIRRGNYDYAVHRDANWTEEFFTTFHEKAIVGRHRSEAMVMQRREIAESIAEKGWEFVCVARDGQCLAAVLCHLESPSYHMARLGWREGDPALVKEGVLSALYWFAMRRARELGAQRLVLGGSPPYLEDGLFRYKAKWNTVLDAPNPAFNVYHILLDPAHPRVGKMLETRSILAIGADDRFEVYSNTDPKTQKLPSLLTAQIARWYRPGHEPGNFSFVAAPDWPAHH